MAAQDYELRMLDVHLDDVHKVYPNEVRALAGVTLNVAAGQCLALVGPSGCGKTTLLRLIAGLENATSGTVRFGDRVMNRVPAHRRDVAMVFQRPALVLGQTVRGNLAWSWALSRAGGFLPQVLGTPRWTGEQVHLLNEVAELLGIGGLLERRAGELSGGQQQRVALGRALLRQAPICLLDEPLGHLELALRTQLRRDLRLLSRRFPATMIHVTHDPAEALAVGDQVAVLHDGRLQQAGSPWEVLNRPANRFVAAFCHPQGPLSFVDGRVEQDRFVAAPWLHLPVPQALVARLHSASAVVGIDGRDVRILAGGSTNDVPGHIITMDVVLTEFAPQGTWVTCRRDGVQITGLATEDSATAIGPRAMLDIRVDRAFWFESATGVTLAGPAG
jgi:ABC-type sugar transport system ATPase subunit